MNLQIIILESGSQMTGQSIHDRISAPQEIINLVKDSRKQPFLIIKIDIVAHVSR